MDSAEDSESKAVAKVMNVPELFEQILLKLDVKDLFRVQRVSNNFKTFIETSKPIQRKLYLLDEPLASFEDSPLEDFINPLILDPQFRLNRLGIYFKKTSYAFGTILKTHISCRIVDQPKSQLKVGLQTDENSSWRKMKLFKHDANGATWITLYSLDGDQTTMINRQIGRGRATLGRLVDVIRAAQGNRLGSMELPEPSPHAVLNGLKKEGFRALREFSDREMLKLQMTRFSRMQAALTRMVVHLDMRIADMEQRGALSRRIVEPLPTPSSTEQG